MNDLLQALKSDLLDRRLLPFLLLLGAVLAAAVAYAVLGGSSSPSSPAPTAAASSPSSGSTLSVSQAPENPHAAVSETTDGRRYQHHAGNHSPFTPLPSKGGGASSSSTSSSNGGSGSSSSSSGSTTSGTGSTGSTSTGASGSGGSTPTTPSEPAPSKPAPPKQQRQPVYLVAVLFGLAPTTPGQLSQLTPYDKLRRLEPLPNPSEPRVVFAGVTDGGKSALFALAGEAILKGEGTCVPSPTQCEAVALGQGKSEELSYLVGEQTVSYELHVVSIAKHEASAARAARLNRRDRAGAALVRRLAPAILRHLRFSAAKSVLVYAAHHGA